ncbi:MAG TPA: methyltransferase domain-containing protein [Micromonosporaceae bacterium]|nr:methyltransferase domain-containing protein [Micromonosporaceae bacterium]
MRQDARAPFHAALHRARAAAFPTGEFVGQESFMHASEIRCLARHAGVGPGGSVLDVCCGVAGPGRLITAEFGCRYLGVDYSASTVEIARQLAGDLPCRFVQAKVPPLPDGRFDVVLLLETMLAFPDKRSLLADVVRVLEPGGGFAFTVEEGRPLTTAERELMPDADTVWLVELGEFTAMLCDVGLTVTWQEEHTASHRAIAAALLQSFDTEGEEIAQIVGDRPLAELIAAHRLWADWLGTGRVRKFAMVAEKL